LSGPHAQLVHPTQLQDGSFGRPGVQQVGNGLPVAERLFVLPRQLDQHHDGGIGQARFMRFIQLGNFRVGNIQALELRDAVQPQSHLVGLLGIRLLRGFAGTDQQG
jgi:hypothetical protein